MSMRILRVNTRPYDIVARYGGDEFAVILPRSGTPQAMICAQRLLDAIATYAAPELPVEAGTIGASIGAALYPEHVIGRENAWVALIEEADAAMYRAKRSGKCRICVAGMD